ncbi:Os11g0695975, partial [Oryza sativa Japonica Group]
APPPSSPGRRVSPLLARPPRTASPRRAAERASLLAGPPCAASLLSRPPRAAIPHPDTARCLGDGRREREGRWGERRKKRGENDMWGPRGPHHFFY